MLEPSCTLDARAIVASYVYDSFGNVTASTGTVENPYRYTAREWDEETGLYYYRARYYDPQVGRFLNEDPIGFGGSVNFYPYVENNPANFIDPFGAEKRSANVPPITNPMMRKFLQCLEKCTKRVQWVTATTNGQHQDPGHAAGTSVDLRPYGTPSKLLFCCAAKCGAKYSLDERFHKTKLGTGAHFHFALEDWSGFNQRLNALPRIMYAIGS